MSPRCSAQRFQSKAERAHLEFKVALNLGGALLPAAAAITIVAISAGESDFIALVRTPTGLGIHVSSTGTLFDIQDTLDNKAIAIVLDVAYGSAGLVRMKIDNTEVVNETDAQTSLSAPSSVEVQLGVAFRGVIGLSTNQVFAKFDDVLGKLAFIERTRTQDKKRPRRRERVRCR